MDKNKVTALINLLDDPDEEVFKIVEQNLLALGREAIPELERAWERSFNNSVMQKRIENLTQHIQLNSTINDLSQWAETDGEDLLYGAFLVAKYQYPDIEFESIKNAVEKIRKDVWLELNDNLTALEKVKILNHIIFSIHKFSRNNTNPYSPQNSFINQVLDNKKGNHVSIAIIYASVAQMLDLPIYGVNLPKNFILVYKDVAGDIEAFTRDENESVLFYINPINNGTAFGKKEIDFFIEQQKLEPNRSYYLPCSNIIVIQRLIDELIFSYERLGYANKIEELKKMRAIVEINGK